MDILLKIKKTDCIRLIVLVGIVTFLILSYPGFEPIPEITAGAAAIVMTIYFGVTPTVYENHIFLDMHNNIYPMTVSPECSGIIVVALFIIVIFLIPDISLKHRFYSFFFAIPLYLANVLRIVSSVIVGDNTNIETLAWYHGTIGQLLIFLAMIVIFAIFLKIFGYFGKNQYVQTS